MKYTQSPGKSLEDFQDGAILIDIDGGRVIEFNESAKFLWECLPGQATKDELIAALCENYSDLDNAQAERDVAVFLEESLACGAVLAEV